MAKEIPELFSIRIRELSGELGMPNLSSHFGTSSSNVAAIVIRLKAESILASGR